MGEWNGCLVLIFIAAIMVAGVVLPSLCGNNSTGEDTRERGYDPTRRHGD